MSILFQQETALSSGLETLDPLWLYHTLENMQYYEAPFLCYNKTNGGVLESLMDYTLTNLISILRKRLQDEEFDGETLTIFLNDSLN